MQPVVHLKIGKYATRMLRWKRIGTPSMDRPLSIPLFADEFQNVDCVIPENIHTSPMEGIFSKTPPPTPLEIPIKLHTFLQIFWPCRTPHPPGKFQSLLWGERGNFLENSYL